VIVEVVFPLSEEVELWLCALSLKCEVNICLVKRHPSRCRGDCVCWYPSSERLILCWLCVLTLVRGFICWERSCVLLSCICPNPQWRFPVWKVLCGRYSKNLSVWRRRRKAGCSNLKTSACVWSTISNSLLFCTLHWFILFIYTYMLGIACVCAPYLC